MSSASFLSADRDFLLPRSGLDGRDFSRSPDRRSRSSASSPERGPPAESSARYQMFTPSNIFLFPPHGIYYHELKQRRPLHMDIAEDSAGCAQEARRSHRSGGRPRNPRGDIKYLLIFNKHFVSFCFLGWETLSVIT